MRIFDVEEETEEEQLQSHYAMVSVYQNAALLADGKLIIEVNLPQLNVELQEQVQVDHVIPVDQLVQIDTRKEELTTRIFEVSPCSLFLNQG